MVKSFAIPSFIALMSLFSRIQTDENRYQKYLAFMNNHTSTTNSFGSYKKGEIEIVRDLKVIKEIEDARKAILLKRGYTKAHAEESSRIGVLAEDEYWMWVRDGVIFPTGARGTYNRIVWKREMTDEAPRVAMLPVLPNGKIVLNLSYRHALRKWVLEIPRGFKSREETDVLAVRRQLKEETGYEMNSCQLLGEVAPESGCLSTKVPVYLVRLGEKKSSNQDYSEAILRNEEFSLSELKSAFSQGSLTIDIKGNQEKVQVCDAYLAYAILQAEFKKSFSK